MCPGKDFPIAAASPNTLCGAMLQITADPKRPGSESAMLIAIYSHADHILSEGPVEEITALYDALKTKWSKTTGLLEQISDLRAGQVTGSRSLINPAAVKSVHARYYAHGGFGIIEVDFPRYLPDTSLRGKSMRNMSVSFAAPQADFIGIASDIADSCLLLSGAQGQDGAIYAPAEDFMSVKRNGREISYSVFRDNWGHSASIAFASEESAQAAYQALQKETDAAKRIVTFAPAVK